jgi:hypothetical protein
MTRRIPMDRKGRNVRTGPFPISPFWGPQWSREGTAERVSRGALVVPYARRHRRPVGLNIAWLEGPMDHDGAVHPVPPRDRVHGVSPAIQCLLG